MLRKVDGFTLIEMAVVLVIIGLMLAAGIGIGRNLIEQSKINVTKENEQAIKLALLNFIIRNNRLPCPAVATLSKSSAGYGVEATTPNTCTNTTIVDNVAIGVIPWKTLGIASTIASDGYYNRLTYQVTLAATGLNANTIAGLKGNMSIHTNAPATNANQSNDCTVGNYNPCSAVVAIISHGLNGYGAYTESGSQLGLPNANTDEEENSNHDAKLVMKEYSYNSANPFDDVIMPLTPSDLLTPLTSKGTFDDYRSVLNKHFADITAAIVADAVSNRSGSAGAYSYPIANTLPSLPVSTTNDPWGNAISYTRNTASIQSGTNSAITAFTLTSNGPDGTLGNQDDISNIVYVSQVKSTLGLSGW